MNVRRGLAVAGILVAALVAVRLGFWQLDRLAGKRAANAALRAGLEAPVLETWGRLPAHATAGGRRVRLRGRYDPGHHVLLRGRAREGAPGVVLVTPFLLEAESLAVPVERGWLPAEDGASAPPDGLPPDTATSVTVLLAGYPRPIPGGALRELGRGEPRVWSAARLERDSLASRLPYRLAAVVARALPGAGEPRSPRRDPPRPEPEGAHLGYAIQWFAIAGLLAGAAVGIARRPRPRAG